MRFGDMPDQPPRLFTRPPSSPVADQFRDRIAGPFTGPSYVPPEVERLVNDAARANFAATPPPATNPPPLNSPDKRAFEYAGHAEYQSREQRIWELARAYQAGYSAALDVAERLEKERAERAGYSEALDWVERREKERAAPYLAHNPKFPEQPPIGEPPPWQAGDPLPQGWSYIRHLRGEYPCGGAAFILTRQVSEFESFTPEVFRYLSGLPVPPDAAANCGTCRREVHPASNADLDWNPHIIRGQRRTQAGFFVEPDAPDPAPSTPPRQIQMDPNYPHPEEVFKKGLEDGFDLPPDAEQHVPTTGEVEAEEQAELRKLMSFVNTPLQEEGDR